MFCRNHCSLSFISDGEPSKSWISTVVSPWVNFTPKPSRIASRTSNKVANANNTPAPLKMDGWISPYGGKQIETTNIAIVIVKHTHNAIVVDMLTRFVIARNSRTVCCTFSIFIRLILRQISWPIQSKNLFP